jgi:clan AA aspartic protease
MLGYVNGNREAIIQIALVGDNTKLKSIKAVIDTGFTGELTLPKAITDELGFPLRGFQEVVLGDGSLQYFEMCAGLVIWNGQKKRIAINVIGTESLVGMGLLENYKLEIETKVNGQVKITSLL